MIGQIGLDTSAPGDIRQTARLSYRAVMFVHRFSALMFSYVKSHWLGKQGLAWSFWVNLVALRVIIFALQTVFSPAEDTDYSQHRAWVLLAAFMLHGVIFIWQVVGVVRSAENHLKETGSQATVWGAQLSVALAFFFTVTYALQAWQFTLPVPTEENHLIRMDREHASKYALDISTDTLRFSGSIELGSTRRTNALLAENPQIRHVILSSDGGNIYEGRGLAELFRKYRLTTHVDEVCASACTIAFSGGTARTASSSARIGFHQYRLDSSVTVMIADPAGEQQKDLQRFREAGFSASMLENVFKSRPQEMWFPTRAELIEGGVLTSDEARHPQ